MNKILFTGGGSAGHVIPNLALMEEILSADMADVCYMGTNGIEKQLVSEWKVPYFQIECPKLIRGHGWGILKRNLKIPTQFLHAVKQATEGLKIYKPDVVFSKGGYVALPVIFAAKKLKIPCLTHESDFSVGLANRIIAGKCNTMKTICITKIRISNNIFYFLRILCTIGPLAGIICKPQRSICITVEYTIKNYLFCINLRKNSAKSSVKSKI